MRHKSEILGLVYYHVLYAEVAPACPARLWSGRIPYTCEHILHNAVEDVQTLWLVKDVKGEVTNKFVYFYINTEAIKTIRHTILSSHTEGINVPPDAFDCELIKLFLSAFCMSYISNTYKVDSTYVVTAICITCTKMFRRYNNLLLTYDWQNGCCSQCYTLHNHQTEILFISFHYNTFSHFDSV